MSFLASKEGSFFLEESKHAAARLAQRLPSPPSPPSSPPASSSSAAADVISSLRGESNGKHRSFWWRYFRNFSQSHGIVRVIGGPMRWRTDSKQVVV
ncbi:hypothetical protein EJ110_NYTH32108 [Nymphaea thermarum]|nr:hypothetical protein EJ110_NYTH32108 [Nymphaea thermarum]